MPASCEQYMPIIRISVRNLVEFIFRSGDIDSGFCSPNRAVEGTRIHRTIQKNRKGNYKSEIPVKQSIDLDDFTLVIEGRIDGVLETDGQFCIEEIKSVTDPVYSIEENQNPVHWAQLTCYAYIFSAKENLSSVDLRLIYCEVETEKTKEFTKHCSFAQLEAFFSDLIKKYEPWARFSFNWISERNSSLKKLTFPFPDYRAGQRELAVSVYKSIKSKRNLFAKAPTGIGKTVSILFPALKAMGEEHTYRIFYLTARTTNRSVAEDALSLLRKQNLHLKYITLTAKEKICFKDKRACTPQSCQYAHGHYTRINSAIWDVIQNNDELKRAVIEDFALKHQVCPFELSLDLSLWCDVIIGDYNYVFDPQVYLKRFFCDNGNDFTFLIDEAHNLVDRSREMFSAQIQRSAFKQIRSFFRSSHAGVYKQLGRVANRINILGKMTEEKMVHTSKEIDSKLCSVLKAFIEECELFLKINRGFDNDDLLKLYFDALAFIRTAALFDSHYLFLVQKVEKDIIVKLFCVDPSFMMSETLKRGKSSIFFSATLSPLPYYREILGGNTDDALISLPSPFDIKNRCFLVATDVSTKYQNREKSYSTLADYLGHVVNSKKGNYLTFFSSYKYMLNVYDIFKKQNPDLKTVIQTSTMSEQQRDQFLENFQSEPEETLLGFCVLGGVFSEGIDLKSTRLIGTIIVGVGLPQICTERDIIKEYFQQNKNCGYEYAYLYPGMNKVMQAAGRVIRSEQDKGVILLIDERYNNQYYRNLFPEEWFPHNRVIINNLGEYLKHFWDQKDEIRNLPLQKKGNPEN
jgi:Rad3-related DNA helicase